MRYISSYLLVKENVAQSKKLWKDKYPDIDDLFTEPLRIALHKNPGYIGGFAKILHKEYNNNYLIKSKLHPDVKYIKEQIASDCSNITRIVDRINEYKQLFKSIDFDSFDKIEELSDYVENSINTSIRNKFMNSFISSKYRFLINDETSVLFDQIKKVIGDDHAIFNDLILKKIASFRDSESFNNFLKQFIKTSGDWSVDKLEQKAINAKANIIFKDTNVLIVETPTWECLKELGTNNWCIVRDDYYWKDYLTEDHVKINMQYIIFDTSKDTSDLTSMIGVTIEPSGNVKAAHLLNDNPADELDYSIWLKYLKRIDTKTLHQNVYKSNPKPILGFKYGILSMIDDYIVQGENLDPNSLKALVEYNNIDIFKFLITKYLDYILPNTNLYLDALCDYRVNANIAKYKPEFILEIVKLNPNIKLEQYPLSYVFINSLTLSKDKFDELMQLIIDNNKISLIEFNASVINDLDVKWIKSLYEKLDSDSKNDIDYSDIFLQIKNVDTFKFFLTIDSFKSYLPALKSSHISSFLNSNLNSNEFELNKTYLNCGIDTTVAYVLLSYKFYHEVNSILNTNKKDYFYTRGIRILNFIIENVPVEYIKQTIEKEKYDFKWVSFIGKLLDGNSIETIEKLKEFNYTNLISDVKKNGILNVNPDKNLETILFQ